MEAQTIEIHWGKVVFFMTCLGTLLVADLLYSTTLPKWVDYERPAQYLVAGYSIVSTALIILAVRHHFKTRSFYLSALGLTCAGLLIFAGPVIGQWLNGAF